MFYELIEQLEAEAQVFSMTSVSTPRDGPFHFEAVPRDGWSGRWSYLRSQRRYVSALARRLRAFDPHVVIIGSDVPAFGWRALAGSHKVLLSVHNTFWPMGQTPDSPKGRARRRILSWQSARVDGAVCTSLECQRQINAIAPRPIASFVEHPQLVRPFEQVRSPNRRSMLFLGRIEENKGIFLLLDTMRDLMDRYLDLTLTYAGTGSQDDALRARIAALGSDRVRFAGQLPAAGVHAAIAQAGLLVCPTTSGFNEGLALVGFEGAAHGVPTLLSSVVPARDFLGQGCFVFKADDKASLIETLDRIQRDSTQYAAACGHLEPVAGRMLDRSLSWGTQMYRCLLAQGGEP
jgi:glycosyltransferase involved in cell wall biosynthesis